MLSEHKINHLKNTLENIEKDFYAGIRFKAKEEYIISLQWAINQLESIREFYPELFLD